MRERVVLVVDDEPALRRLLADVLPADLGVRVTLAADGDEALSRVRDEPPDLVLLDLKLPNVDGFEVLRRLKADPTTRPIPVVALTGAGAPRIREAVAEGADDWISKPFDLGELTARLARWLGRDSARARTESRALAQAVGRIARPGLGLDQLAEAVAEEAERLVAADDAALYLAERGGFVAVHAGRLAPPGSGVGAEDQLEPDELALEAIARGQALFSANPLGDEASRPGGPPVVAAAVVPLLFTDELIGVLYLRWTHAPFVTAGDLGLLQTFGEHVADVLRTARTAFVS